jgi:signal transduction histidine kinase
MGDGLSQIRVIRDKFMIASNLKGSHSSDPPQPTTLKSLYEQTARVLAAKTQAKNISISLENNISLTTQNLNLTALVLATLLDNAVAYSPQNGEIKLSGQTIGGTANIAVVDHGSGVPTDKMASLFQPLSKAEGVEVSNHEGMGFSLYLDKLIMAYLGGSIEITSEPGHETRANFTLPAVA